MKKVRCPGCGSTVFYRRMTEPVELRICKVGFQSVVVDASCDAQPEYWCSDCDRGLEADDINGSEIIARGEVARYTACIFEPTDVIEVRRLPCGRSTWHRAYKLADAAGALLSDNEHDKHIYAGANPRRARGGTRSRDVACARCLFVDFDGIGPDAARDKWQKAGLPAPTLTIASGHGVHVYWRLTEAITDLPLWSSLQKKLIALLDSDRAIHDPARIMRLPGFVNHKEPVAACHIVDGDPRRIHDLDSLMPALNSARARFADGNELQRPVNLLPKMKTRFGGNLNPVKEKALLAANWAGVAKGQRNCKAFQHAAFLVNDLSLSDEQAWSIMREWNRKNRPPLSGWELRRVMCNARYYGKHAAATAVA